MIRIVTDTTCCMTIEEHRRLGTIPVPLYITQGEKSFRELFEISYDEFYAGQRSGLIYRTSQPDPQSFLAAFQPVVVNGDEIICITLSNQISGTFGTAGLAAGMTDHPEWITIFDSFSSGFGQACLVQKAAALAAEGFSRADILKTLEEMRRRTQTYFIVDSLHHLYEGGRLNGAQAIIGSIIQIKPIIWFDHNGVMTAFEKIRTLKAAKSRVLELVKERAALGIEKIGLHCCDNDEEASGYARMIEDAVQIPVPLVKLSPVITAHTGPDILGPCIITTE